MEKLLELREKLLKEALLAREMFEHYITLHNSMAANPEETKFADIFFNVSHQALLECSTLRLCKMYDRNPQSFSLLTFLRTIEKYVSDLECEKRAAFMPIHSEQLLLLQNLETKLTLLRKLRDKDLAHNDLDFFDSDDIWGDIGLTIKDYRELLELPLQMINKYNILLDQSYEQFLHFNHQAEGIFVAIKHYLKCDSISDD